MDAKIGNTACYKLLKGSTVGVVGVSEKDGQSHSGPELAPETLRKSGLFDVIKSNDWKINDYGDIKDTKESTVNVDLHKDVKKVTNLKSNISKIGHMNKALHDISKTRAEKGEFSLTLGGDAGILTGSISGMKAHYPNLKVIFVGAHGNFNTPETSLTGNYHVMPIAHLLGLIPEGTVPGFDWFKPCLTSKDICIFGLRNIDTKEKVLLRKHNIKCFTMHEILKNGIGDVLNQAIEYLRKDDDKSNPSPIHITFDIDAIDPSEAFATGTKSRGGLLYREAQYLVREVANTGCLVGLDIVEINPLMDTKLEKFHGDNRNITADTETVALGLEIISCALGDFLEMFY